MRQGTDDEPNGSLQARAIELEQSGSLGVSVFTGFPHADIYDAGFSVVAMTDDDADSAQAQVNEILSQAWEQRDAFVYDIEALPASMQRAKAAASVSGDGPVIVLDHYDNTASGGTMDTTEVLSAVLDAGLERVAVFGFLTLTLSNKWPPPVSALRLRWSLAVNCQCLH